MQVSIWVRYFEAIAYIIQFTCRPNRCFCSANTLWRSKYPTFRTLIIIQRRVVVKARDDKIFGILFSKSVKLARQYAQIFFCLICINLYCS